ncbi:hypothetical protein JZ751_002880 [Albula glossodonta]|uniref:Uncharacterized protein n=1 Tax=Albula glossodonta TaxID=121402 RepID=A0A8T2N840_9TELE|nr:hypothetical protein JZ751_002880 [Albula glossodonta]
MDIPFRKNQFWQRLWRPNSVAPVCGESRSVGPGLPAHYTQHRDLAMIYSRILKAGNFWFRLPPELPASIQIWRVDNYRKADGAPL